MFNFNQFIQDKVINYPKFQTFRPRVQIEECCVRIISPVDKDLEIVFIQHDELYFEAKLEIYFKHKKYGECWDMLIDIDCLPQKTESGFYCLFSEERNDYPTLESLLFDLLLKPILEDKVLDHFFYSGIEFWVKEDNGIQVATFSQNAEMQYKFRKKGWVQLKGNKIDVDENMLLNVVELLKLNNELKISEIQRRFSLGYNRALNLLSVAKVIIREKE